jgi:hypothetical protein
MRARLRRMFTVTAVVLLTGSGYFTAASANIEDIATALCLASMNPPLQLTTQTFNTSPTDYLYAATMYTQAYFFEPDYSDDTPWSSLPVPQGGEGVVWWRRVDPAPISGYSGATASGKYVLGAGGTYYLEGSDAQCFWN